MRVLITGAGGQLGLDLVDEFADHEVIGTTHGDLDISDEAAVFDRVATEEPSLVINAAAWTDVDGCEEDPDRAHRINALGPWWLARACEHIGATLVQLSTDYVFGGDPSRQEGEVPRPYIEFDQVAPINEYGRSKAAGELLVRETLPEHYIVRTSWLSGARGENFVTKMLRIGEERGVAEVVDDQIGSPTFTRDLAAAIRELSATARFGTYHRTNSGTCSWHGLASATFELIGQRVDLRSIKTEELDQVAVRPRYSALSGRHALATGLRSLPPWREGLTRMLDELSAARQVPS
jgi:dTDP-4-dehydrorhamnose reductase